MVYSRATPCAKVAHDDAFLRCVALALDARGAVFGSGPQPTLNQHATTPPFLPLLCLRALSGMTHLTQAQTVQLPTTTRTMLPPVSRTHAGVLLRWFWTLAGVYSPRTPYPTGSALPHPSPITLFWWRAVVCHNVLMPSVLPERGSRWATFPALRHLTETPGTSATYTIPLPTGSSPAHAWFVGYNIHFSQVSVRLYTFPFCAFVSLPRTDRFHCAVMDCMLLLLMCHLPCTLSTSASFLLLDAPSYCSSCLHTGLVLAAAAHWLTRTGYLTAAAPRP